MQVSINAKIELVCGECGHTEVFTTKVDSLDVNSFTPLKRRNMGTGLEVTARVHIDVEGWDDDGNGEECVCPECLAGTKREEGGK